MDSTNSLTTSSTALSSSGNSASQSRKRSQIEHMASTIESMHLRTFPLGMAVQEFGDSCPSMLSSISHELESTNGSVPSIMVVDDDKRVQRNTLGNRHLPAQAKRREARAHHRLHNPNSLLSDLHTQEELFAVLQKSLDCCPKNEEYGGCIRNAFCAAATDADGTRSFDLVGALMFIQRAREQRGNLCGEKLDSFIQEKVRSAIVGEKLLANGEIRFDMRWCHDGHELCRQSFGLIFNISKHKLDSCLSELKKSDTRYVTSISTQEWKDDHIHGYTFAETEEMMKKNLGITVVGKY